MIFLKANAELELTFERLIQTMNVPVKWNHIFAVLNNYLILPGEVRSVVFNFDNRKVNTNIIEVPLVEDAALPVEKNALLTNILNMILYVFGKWGTIPGIKVEKDYVQLNQLFTGILRDLKVESDYRDDGFRFYRRGIQITYEDVVQAAVEAGEKEEPEEGMEEEQLGLWHNMCWMKTTASFQKEKITRAQQAAERIGNNFYMVGYQCPECGKNLYMVVYPVDKEFPVETEEGKVYLARAYACDNCNRFYTPRPGKLLVEGDIYLLDFDTDRKAYEDYQELLGERGEKTSNYKFNEYEWERNRKEDGKEPEKEPEEMEEAELRRLEEMVARQSIELIDELLRLEDKLESGFLSPEQEKRYEAIKEEIEKKQTEEKEERNRAEEKNQVHKESFNEQRDNRIHSQEKEAAEMEEMTECTSIQKKLQADLAEHTDKVFEAEQQRTRQEIEKVKEKYNARMKVLERMSLRQMKELLEKIKKEKVLTDAEKAEYIEQVKKHIRKNQEKELQKRAESARKGNYVQMCRVISEIEESDCPEEIREPILSALYEEKQKKAQKEAEELIVHMPAVMDRKRYKLFREKLKQYKEADISAYEEQLEAKREQAEKQEIASLVNRTNKNDRESLFRVWELLQEPDFSRENTEKVLGQLHDRIQKLDEAAIEKICPNIMGMTFDEGAEAYEKIAEGMFLPELKENTLEMIDKRLTKIKSDESELLVKKLKEGLGEPLKDSEELHYYEARKAMRGEWEGEEAVLIENARKKYASEHGRYEYPVVVCDSTRKGTGKEGFLLTPDNLFYNSTFSSECIPILQIKKISYSTGLLNKGIYVHQKNGEKTKIPVGISAKYWEKFVCTLNEFISYLQEKPASRKVAYLKKEEHEVKCCYRCGYVYKGVDVCPKCGSRENR